MSKIKFKNNQDEAVRVATTGGFTVIVEPGKTREVPEKFKKECLGAGLNEVKSGNKSGQKAEQKSEEKTEQKPEEKAGKAKS
jgi:hypothetical protein